MFVVIFFVVLWAAYDTPYKTGKHINGVVTQSVQMFPRYQETYYRTIVKIKNKHLIQIDVPITQKCEKGQTIKLEIIKRKISGGLSYELANY